MQTELPSALHVEVNLTQNVDNLWLLTFHSKSIVPFMSKSNLRKYILP